VIFHFTKMHGAGNDFLILDHMGDRDVPPRLYPHEVAFFCHRQFGIGADGLVMLFRGSSTDAAWRFYNSDGSEAEMCGNAARCAIKLLHERHFPGSDQVISIETKAGVIRGKTLAGDTVEITLVSEAGKRFEYQERVIQTEKNAFDVYCIDTGVPHAVIEVKDIRSYPIEAVGRLLVSHSAFGPAGANVTFFQRLVGSHIRSTTFERGVERETLACGTGAAAAAVLFTELYMQSFPVEVAVPGGQLTVDMSPVSKLLLLRGPAQVCFKVDMAGPEGPFEPPVPFGERKKAK